MKILMVASEAVPVAKTGGLADMVGALAAEVGRMGHEVRLAVPGYRDVVAAPLAQRETRRFGIPLVDGPAEVSIETGALNGGKVTLVVVRYDPFFARSGLYGEGGSDYPDNLFRFALFCRATLEACHQAVWTPDVLHAHDWQGALSIVYLKTLFSSHPPWTTVPALFTVHNVGYQGIFPATSFSRLGLPWSEYRPDRLEFHGQINLLKGGLIYADLLSTVSPTYAHEILTSEFGEGLEGVLQERKERLFGILNGIDYDAWNPATDPHLPAHYSAKDLDGKKACKSALQREMKFLARDVPLFGLISRLADQKGIDLILDVLPKLLALDVQIVILGVGDPGYHARLTELSELYSGKLAVRLSFDEGLAHRIEAGADMFLMPSRYEPCGLNQLYSLRYGTVPIVRKTGGLADTVAPYLPGHAETATGFVFESPHPEVLLSTIFLALEVYRDRKQWTELMRRGMQQDFSWRRSARQYVELYERARAMASQPIPTPRPSFPRPQFRA